MMVMTVIVVFFFCVDLVHYVKLDLMMLIIVINERVPLPIEERRRRHLLSSPLLAFRSFKTLIKREEKRGEERRREENHTDECVRGCEWVSGFFI